MSHKQLTVKEINHIIAVLKATKEVDEVKRETTEKLIEKMENLTVRS